MKSATGQRRIDFGSPWTETKDGDPDCRALFDRHYSRHRYADGRESALFVGPGGKLVLVTPDLKALFVWRRFIDDADDGSGKRQEGVNCAIFRNEGEILSSDLIRAAEPFAWGRWPEESRLYSYVDAAKIRSRNPGFCFIAAGWKRCGVTKGGKIIIEKRRTTSPSAAQPSVSREASSASASHPPLPSE